MADTLAMAMYQIGELKKQLADQAAEIARIEERNAQRDREREDHERQWLKWGIMTIGGVAVTLAGVIWGNLNVILGRAP